MPQPPTCPLTTAAAHVTHAACGRYGEWHGHLAWLRGCVAAAWALLLALLLLLRATISMGSAGQRAPGRPAHDYPAGAGASCYGMACGAAASQPSMCRQPSYGSVRHPCLLPPTLWWHRSLQPCTTHHHQATHQLALTAPFHWAGMLQDVHHPLSAHPGVHGC